MSLCSECSYAERHFADFFAVSIALYGTSILDNVLQVLTDQITSLLASKLPICITLYLLSHSKLQQNSASLRNTKISI